MLGPSGFDTIIEMWLPLAWALNMVNRSLGRDDVYPFVLPTVVLEKMRFIHTVIDEMASDPATLASAGDSPRRDGRAHAPRTLDGRRSKAALAPHPGGGDPARRRGGLRPRHHDGHRRRRGSE
jgi:hypothetical protein